MSICLCMIVKDESHIIENTLNNICQHIKLDYWIISDTGSTDDTPSIIQNFFNQKNIKGELHHNPWKDFAHNRTLALEYAYNKRDYVFVFDADDSIVGKLVLPTLTHDRYEFIFGDNFSYTRSLLINNHKKWWYTGVLHEYLDTDEFRSAYTIKGDYHIISGRTGSRSKNPNKYRDDALVLEKAIQEEPREHLKSRYSYYCGQSYKDAGDPENAILWFKKCTELNSWNQEKYCAAYYIGELYSQLNNFELAQLWFCKTIQYDSERMEGIIMACEQLYKADNHVMINALYHTFKKYKHHVEKKLFLRNDLYDYHLEYYNSISAYYINDLLSGYVCCKLVIMNCTDINKVTRTIHNVRFYKSYYDNDKQLQEFIQQKYSV